MPDRPSFPIPDNPTPETYCLQIVMPNDPVWKAVIAGLLWQPAEWFNWQRNDAKTGTILAQYWREIYNDIDWSDMSCCCPDRPPVQYKYISNVLYRSTDGGITFEPAPEYDYRNTSVQWPLPGDLGISSNKCQVADSVVAVFRDKITQQVNEDMGAVAILSVIVAALLIFLSEGTTAAISAQITAVVTGIVGAGVAAWLAAFTSDVWDDLRCLIYSNMEDDVSITQEGLDAVYAGIDSTFTGIVVPTLKGYIAAAGLVGINNMMKELDGDPDADCSACSCGFPMDLLTSYCSVGAIDSHTDEYIILSSAVWSGTGGQSVAITTGDNAVNFHITAIETISGGWNFAAYAADGETIPSCGAAFPHNGLTVPCEASVNTLLIYASGGAFTIKVYISSCPCP